MSPQLFATVHVGACAAALMLGAAVAAAPKGTAWHRRAGRAFMASMLVLNLSALGLYRLNGTFNGFHVLALISLAGLVAGWWCGRGARRSPLRRAAASWCGSNWGAGDSGFGKLLDQFRQFQRGFVITFRQPAMIGSARVNRIAIFGVAGIITC